MQNSEVEVCGYVVPHPSDECVHLRIQLYQNNTTTTHHSKSSSSSNNIGNGNGNIIGNGVTVFTVLKKALMDLKSVSAHVLDRFTSEVVSFPIDIDSTMAGIV